MSQGLASHVLGGRLTGVSRSIMRPDRAEGNQRLPGWETTLFQDYPFERVFQRGEEGRDGYGPSAGAPTSDARARHLQCNSR